MWLKPKVSTHPTGLLELCCRHLAIGRLAETPFHLSNVPAPTLGSSTSSSKTESFWAFGGWRWFPDVCGILAADCRYLKHRCLEVSQLPLHVLFSRYDCSTSADRFRPGTAQCAAHSRISDLPPVPVIAQALHTAIARPSTK